MRSKIISLGTAAPTHIYTQEQIFAEMGYPHHHFWSFFRDSAIDTRHFWVPLNRIRKLSFQEQQEEYLKGAITLSKQAISDCLDGRDPKEIGCLIFCSWGIAPGPTVGHYLVKEVGFRPDIEIRNIQGQGCEGGGFPGIATATDYVTAKGKPALVVTCEISSCAYFPEESIDSENDFELLRSNSIFADFATAALISNNDHVLKHPFILGSGCYTNPNYLGDLGFQWRDGRLRVKLSKRVPYLAKEVTEAAVRNLLSKHSMEPSDINYWIIHSGGVAIIEAVQEGLGIGDTRFSKEFLRKFGNCSSASVGGTGKMFIEEVEPREGEYLVIVTVGPGMSGGAHLLQFGDES